MGLSAVLWTGVAVSTLSSIGALNTTSFFVYLCLYLIISTAGPTLAPNRNYWVGFIALLGGVPTFASYLINPDANLVWMAVCPACCVAVYRLGLVNVADLSRLLHEKDESDTQLRYLRSIIESVPGLVTIFDQDLSYKMINSEVSHFTGLQEKDFVGKTLGFSNTNFFTEFVKKFSQSELPRAYQRVRLDGGNGAKWFLVSLSRLEPYSQIVAVSIDINNQVLAEEQATEQQAVAESNSRLAAVGDLAAGVAHEINNPLAIIQASTEQIKRISEVHGLTDLIAPVERIKSTVKRASKIVKNLVELAQFDSEKNYETIPLQEVVATTLTFFNEKLTNHNIKVEVQVPANLKIQCHPIKIEQIILSFLNNSFYELKKAGRAGLIRIQAIEVSEDLIEIAVLDNGPGVPEHLHKRIMDPFFTTKPAGQGAGLGLAAARRIAQSHLGDIYLDTQSPLTKFVLRIPKFQTEKAKLFAQAG